MGEGTVLTIRRVDEIPPEKSGKYRYVVSKVLSSASGGSGSGRGLVTLLTSTVSALAHALPATRANRLLILIYHRVHPRPDPMFPGEVDAERFDWQMGMLARYCSPLPLAEAVAGLQGGQAAASSGVRHV